MLKTILTVLVMIVSASTIAAADTLSDRVHELLRIRDFDTAESTVRLHLEGNKADANAVRLLGLVYMCSGRWDDVIKQGKRAVTLEPNNADSHLTLASGYRAKARRGGRLGMMRNARKWRDELETALELDPENLEARVWVAAYLANAPGIGGGDKDRAVEIARGTAAIDEYRGRVSLGYTLRRRGDYDESIAESKKAIALAPDSVGAYGGLGYTYLAAQRYAEAEAAMRVYIEKDPRNPQAHEGLGDCFRDQDRADDAISAYEKGVECDPYAWSVRWELARMLHKSGDKEGAILHYRELIERTPNAVTVGKAKKYLRKLKGKR
jgi:tetratricopeptide (TPR) repeat protein